MPLAVGVTLMVIVLEANAAVTPAGKPIVAPMPVAPVVACVILIKAVLMQSVGVLEAAPTVLSAETVMVPVAFKTTPQPPDKGIL